MLVSQLHAVGFAVETADDGVEALEAFRSGRYALVFSDLNMPRMDGFELVGEIRALEAAGGRARTPVIALTANVMQGEPERCRAAGMDDFVGKPTTIPFLAAKLRRWLPHVAWPAPAAVAAAGARARRPAATCSTPRALSELTGGDEALADEVLEDFLEESRADLAACGAADERATPTRCAPGAPHQRREPDGRRPRGPRDRRRIEAEAAHRSRTGSMIELLDRLADALARVAAAAERAASARSDIAGARRAESESQHADRMLSSGELWFASRRMGVIR